MTASHTSGMNRAERRRWRAEMTRRTRDFLRDNGRRHDDEAVAQLLDLLEGRPLLPALEVRVQTIIATSLRAADPDVAGAILAGLPVDGVLQ